MNLAPYVPTPTKSIRTMLELAGVGADDVVYDVGSGDGRMVISAVRDFNAEKAVGIELRSDLVTKAHTEIRRLHLQGRVEIVHGDALQVDVSDADVVTLYLTSHGNRRLRPKLERELKPGARVVSRHYRVDGWKPIKVTGHIYLYQLGQSEVNPPLSALIGGLFSQRRSEDPTGQSGL